MSRCTAPVYGHRTASGAANCPACGSRSYYRSPSYYTPPTRPSWSGGGGSSSGGSSGGGKSRRLRGGGAVSYTAAEWRTIEPLARQAEEQAREHPERRDLFLCHAWDDRKGAARELCDLLVSLGATVWFSEKDVGLGKSLLREIDKGLANSRIGIVLVTPALLKSLAAERIADKELSALLATDRVIPVAHGTTFDALRDVSPLLARTVRSEHRGLVDAGRRDQGRRCGGRRGRHLTGATTPRPIRCRASCCRCAAAQHPTNPRDD